MAEPFNIIPAIDLRADKVVRLTQGNPGSQTCFGDNPRQWAERWQSEGPDWLHFTNLDGVFGDDTRLNQNGKP